MSAVNAQVRVLQLSTMVPPATFGGAESVVGAFGEQLAGAGFHVENRGLKARGSTGAGSPIPNLYWPFDGRGRGVAARLAWHGIDALTLAARRTAGRVVDEVAPDVIVAHNLRGWGLAPWVVAAQRGIPVVQVLHDYGLMCNASTLFHGGRDCTSVSCRLRRQAAQRRWPGGPVVAVSHAVLSEHQRRGFDTGATAAVVYPLTAATPVARSTRERGTGVPRTVGYLGRLTAEKGVDLLLQAVASCGQRLVIAGDGEASEVDALRAGGPANVQWRGRMQPEALFDEIDVLVVPSRWREPFGLVVVEAARAGVPVLLADQPGLLEAARASGAQYRAFAANDVGALTKALQVPIGEYRNDDLIATSADIVDVVRDAVAPNRNESAL